MSMRVSMAMLSDIGQVIGGPGGGIAGALGFKHFGFKVTVPLAAFLCFLAARPLLLELRLLLHRLRRQWAPEDQGSRADP